MANAPMAYRTIPGTIRNSAVFSFFSIALLCMLCGQKLSGYFRWINDHDDREQLYYGIQFSGTSPGLHGIPMSTIDHPNPGHSYSGTAIWTITPTLVNETTVAES